MSWIQENRFAAGLGGFTAVAAIGLIGWGFSNMSAYSKAKDDYQTASDAISTQEKERLYPSEENVRAKKEAVSKYKDDVEKLQKSFDPFRVTEFKTVEPAVFTQTLKDVQAATVKTLTEENKVELDPKFYMGFEVYTRDTVKGGATGILGYELDAVSELFKELAAAKPDKITNVRRDALEEENNGKFDPQGKSFRALPIEITFTGSEASLRKFLSSLDDSKKYYYVIRTLKVANTNQTAPTSASAEFKQEEAAPAPESGGDGGAGAIVLPGEEPPAAPANPGAPAGDSAGKILLQVLGAEKLQVFLRIEILQFLAPRELPKS